MKFQFGILTSLHDDDAVTLLRALDSALASGQINAEVPCVLCNIPEHPSDTELARRVEAVKALHSLRRLIFFPSREFAPELREQSRARWRAEHDRALLQLLPQGVRLYLSVGYMQILSAEILNALDVLNLHPAIPQIGPIGMWPKVMEEQALRPLPYLLAVPHEKLAQEIPEIMSISYLKAGGMLHIATEQTDRGPVISWYEFPLSSERLKELWIAVTARVRAEGLERVRREPIWKELVHQIRREQFQYETPLILLTLAKLSAGLWEIRERTLYIDGQPYPHGYCLNQEIVNRPPI
jgi:folate-dependent phosphoribosylglycinamide formyltransferase PurN